ncbi:TldD/PmbA family protein [Romboutsia sp.]|uniref:TldD/PmbA family protein n=1 Tax=Romboutsia sp. TaxID=1965302 RepID=UPI003F32A265
MEFNIFKEKLFEKALSEGFKECEVYYHSGESLNISVFKEEIEKYSLEKSFGLSFRGKINEKIGYSYTEILDEDAIEMLVTNARASILVTDNEDVQFIYEGDENYQEVKTYSEKLDNIEASKIIDLAMNLEKEAKNYSSKVINTNGCKVVYTSSQNGIYNTKGLNLKDKSNLLYGYVVPVVEDNNEKQDGMGYLVANSFEDIDAKQVAKYGVDEALSKIGGKSIKSGKYKAVILNEAMVSLMDTFSQIFSGDAAQKGLSLLKGKEGEKVAADIVTIVDNPLLDFGLASHSFDDEGVATYKKEIICSGKLNTLLHNLKTAHKQGIKTTGNGFKASYSSPVGVAPTNFYLEKGEKSIDDLMNIIGEGILVTDFAGLHSGANAISGDFSLAAKGFYIKDGKKDFPIEQITVAGNYFDLLKNIENIGNDLKFPLNNVGSPSVIVRELSIAGKEK